MAGSLSHFARWERAAHQAAAQIELYSNRSGLARFWAIFPLTVPVGSRLNTLLSLFYLAPNLLIGIITLPVNYLREQINASPAHARVVPYVVLLVLTFLQDSSESTRYWIYLAKMLVGLWCIFEMRKLATEVRWAFSWEAVVVGIAMCVVWVGLDPYYPKNEVLMKLGNPWNPFKQYGEGSFLGWFFVAVRTFGSALVVPPIEEAFYRSFLYRYFVRINFTELSLTHWHALSFFVTALLFGVVHYQWVGGVICGMSYQWLVLRKGRLGDAITAHAITNFTLGIWVAWQDAWIFW